ncbi:MAG: PQQ-binding-like beta-propeller repeat protein [Candidatus Cloacimonas sp.]|nr:PQQ-like beta-propeller repeat protein [Candidatus Cloacimonadota bacterium]
MSIKIFHSENHKSNLYFSDYFQQKDRNLVLMLHYRDEQPYYSRTTSYILEQTLKLGLENTPWGQIETKLKEFLLNLNWELHAQFRKFDTVEQGISLLLIVTEEEKLCFTACGRFLCGLVFDEELTVYGNNWENFNVKTRAELGLLGAEAKDYHKKIISIDFPHNSTFIAFSADQAYRIDLKEKNDSAITEYFATLFQTEPFPYAILHKQKEVELPKTSWYKAKQFRFSAVLLILMLIFSMYYFFRGNNIVEDKIVTTREQFNLTVSNIDLSKLQEGINIDLEALLTPARNIQLVLEWEKDLSFDGTSKPYYDMRQFYLASKKSLYSLNKRDREILWHLELEEQINSLKILDSNLLLASTNKNLLHCIKRDSGEIVWSAKTAVELTSKDEEYFYSIINISLETDRRLNNSVLIVPKSDGLTVVNPLNGDTLANYQSTDKIKFVSEYDILDKSLYLVEGEKLLKIRLDVLS